MHYIQENASSDKSIHAHWQLQSCPITVMPYYNYCSHALLQLLQQFVASVIFKVQFVVVKLSNLKVQKKEKEEEKE